MASRLTPLKAVPIHRLPRPTPDSAVPRSSGAEQVWRDVTVLVRPRHWIKNLLLLTPPFFGGQLLADHIVSTSVLAIGAFSLAASAGYIVNDLFDRAHDRKHPTKRQRPLAAERMSLHTAIILAIGLSLGALLLATAVSDRFWVYLLGYLALSSVYSWCLKKLFLVDVFAIAGGFIVRVLAGGHAFGVEVSNWLFLTLFFISLFMASGKRMSELLILGKTASIHRKSLSGYSEDFLKGVFWITATLAVVTYALYTVEGPHDLFYTVPIATYGMLRYLHLVTERKMGDPTELLLADKQLIAVLALWAGILGSLIYR